MKRAFVCIVLLLLAAGLSATEESFESKIIKKETQEVFGNGTLSVSTTVYSVTVLNKTVKQYMKIEVDPKAFDDLHVGDLIRVTFEKGWLGDVTIKAIKVLERSTP